jgi:hypothetical protein
MRAITSKRPLELGGRERLVDDLLVELVREVVVQLAAVDGPLAGAGHDAHPGDRLLATAGGRGGSDGRRLERSVGARRALGGVGDALLVDLEGLAVVLGAGLGVYVSHGVPLRVRLGR